MVIFYSYVTMLVCQRVYFWGARKKPGCSGSSGYRCSRCSIFFETTSVVENILEIVICHEHMVHHTGVGNSVLRFCRFGCVHLAKQQMTCPEYSNSMWSHERATAVLSICNRETHKNDQWLTQSSQRCQECMCSCCSSSFKNVALLAFVQDASRIPVLGHADGICAVYVGASKRLGRDCPLDQLDHEHWVLWVCESIVRSQIRSCSSSDC